VNAGETKRSSWRAGRREFFMTVVIASSSPIGLRSGVLGNTRHGASGKASRLLRRLNTRDIFATQNSILMKKLEAGL
jgi:hypothetical protein